MTQRHIYMPLVARTGPSAPQLVGILLSKLATPLPDGFVGDGDTPFEQEFLHVTGIQAKATGELYGMTNDFGRKAMILGEIGGGLHARRTSHQAEASNKLTMLHRTLPNSQSPPHDGLICQRHFRE
jgi:hypothetical protein